MKMSSFYICVPKITIIWCMLPKIWVQHTIICHFGSLLALKIKTWKQIRRYFLLRMYTEIFVILGHFLPFYPTNKPKKQNFDKMKKNPLKILSFYICLPPMTIIWCMVPEIWSTTGKIFSHWDHCLSFYWKMKILRKKTGDIINLHLCAPNDNHMMYGSLDIRCNGQSFLWTVFCSFDPPP